MFFISMVTQQFNRCTGYQTFVIRGCDLEYEHFNYDTRVYTDALIECNGCVDVKILYLH